MATAVAAFLVIVVAAGAAATEARGHLAAALFWAQALPGTPMPAVIADLVQRGADRSPLAEPRSAANYLVNSHMFSYFRYSVERDLPPPAGAPAVEGLFFHESEMRAGGAMTVSLPAASPAAFLPRAAADRIPFGNFTYALGAFSVSPGSDEAARVSDTLRSCNAPALAGEEKACATSLEGVVLTATRMLATTGYSQIVASASTLPSTGLPRGQYAVQAVTPLVVDGGGRFVVCHALPYPYAVYGCHLTLTSSKAYVVSILRRSAAEPAIAMAAVCHFDTSDWSPNHMAFQALHTKPGGSPVCHFLPYADVVFGTNTGPSLTQVNGLGESKSAEI